MTILKPFPFQEQVAELLLSGKNVILQAPTGAGKTFAALLPFYHAWRQGGSVDFPGKCVYVVPMRVLAHQFVEEAKSLGKSYQRRFGESPSVTIQTGDQPDDPSFEGELIFCTIDQFLSSYLTAPYSLNYRWANLNAGAFIGSYLVFDEFHLLDPGSTLPTTLFAIKHLSKIAPVLLMTATFSKEMLSSLAQEIHAEVVVINDQEAERIETRNGAARRRERVWKVADGYLSAEAVLREHKGKSIALCNTVQRAQRLFGELESTVQEQGLDIELVLLHSRFLAEDRNKHEAFIRSWFGKEAQPGKNVIAVTTQAIEVGVDVSSYDLHTELAPASSMIQRAGRCARYPGEQGCVWVYPVEKYGPYGQAKSDPDKENLWVKEMRAALEWLKEHSGETFDFIQEQSLINAVAAARDRQILEGIAASEGIRKEKIFRFISGDRQPNDTRLLVRDADSRKVLISSNPDRLLRAPFAATGFNVEKGTLMGMIKGWLEREGDFEWRVKVLESADSEEGEIEYAWIPLHDAGQLIGRQVIVVNPELAGYTVKEGFLPDKGNTSFESSLPADADRKTWERHSYRLESYETHVQHVLQALERDVLPAIRYPAKVLEKAAGFPAGSLEKAAWLTCLLHDTGKLSQGWQDWAHAYQQAAGHPVEASFGVAHTDKEWKNPDHDRAAIAVRGKHPRPNHAAEGALAVHKILYQALRTKELTQAAITAISRHHAPFVEECHAFVLDRFAAEHIRNTISLLPDPVKDNVDLDCLVEETQANISTFSGLLANPRETYTWLAYLLLTRALRIADQHGTEAGNRNPVTGELGG